MLRRLNRVRYTLVPINTHFERNHPKRTGTRFGLKEDVIPRSSQPTIVQPTSTQGLSFGVQQPAAPFQKIRHPRSLNLPDLSQIGISNTSGEEVEEKESTGVHNIISFPKIVFSEEPLFEKDFTSSLEEKGGYDAISIHP